MTDKKKQAQYVLECMITAMQKHGFKVESPYDVENFFDDYGSHTNIFEAMDIVGIDSECMREHRQLKEEI